LVYYVMTLADNAAAENDLNSLDKYQPMTLQSVLRVQGPLPADEVRSILKQVLGGLCELHNHGVSHGDVKPDNIMRIGGTWQLGDVGLASAVGENGGSRGTPAYWPPEETGGPAGDLYAWGLTAWVALTGRAPKDYHTPDNHSVESDSRDRVATELFRLVDRACHTDTARRFPNAQEMLAALRATEPRTGLSRRNAIVAGGSAAASIVGFGVWWLNDQAPIGPLIKKMQVEHDPGGGKRSVELDSKSEAPRENDGVRIIAEFDKRAYCYLIAFNTDGSIELCDPADAGAAPESVRELRFPLDRSNTYILNKGAGMQAFAIVASRQNLPSFKTWRDGLSSLHWEHLDSTWEVRRPLKDVGIKIPAIERKFERFNGEDVKDTGAPPQQREKDAFGRLCDLLMEHSDAVQVVTFPVMKRYEP
jgi:serine/threonine protein kinase